MILNSGTDLEILNRGGIPCQPLWLADEKNLRFGLKRPKQRSKLYVFGKIFLSAFSIFLNVRMPMKSYQFLKICKRLDKEREKTLMQQSMRKEKLRKVGLCFFFYDDIQIHI